MADNNDNSEDDDKLQLSPKIGTPCDELDISELFEGHGNSEVKFEVGDSGDFCRERQSSLEKSSDVDSASSELEDIYVAELGVTPPRNLRRLKERIKSRKKSQERGETPPKLVIEKADTEKKKRDREQRARVRENNQTQITNERASQRQFKRNSLGNEYDINGLSNSRSMDIPSMKIESRNRFMSLKCTRRDLTQGGRGDGIYSSVPKVKLTRSESDPRSLSMMMHPGSAIMQSRNDFFRTFSLLIKIGAHARKQQDSQFATTELERQNSEEHKKWQVELRLALWLELRAWHAGRTMDEQDQFLMEERHHVDDVIKEIINFNSNSDSKGEDNDATEQPLSMKVIQIEESSNRGVAEMPPTIFISGENDVRLPEQQSTPGQSETSLSDLKDLKRQLSLDLSRHKPDTVAKQLELMLGASKGPSPPKKFAEGLECAIVQVTDLFDRLEAAEHLYPNLRSVGEYHMKYNSSEFQRNLDALQLWLNIAKDLICKLQLTARFLGVDRHDEATWHDWLDVGLGLLVSVYPEYDFSASTSDSDSDSFDDEILQLQPTSPLPSEEPRTPKSPAHRTSSSVSQYTWTSTSRFRPFVDRSIKKLGLIKLGKRIGDILDTTLLKAKQVLTPEGAKSHYESSWPIQQWQSNITQLENLLYRDVATEMRPRSQTQSALKEVAIEQCAYGIPWSTEFKNLGLPSFCKLFLFLSRIPLDISHECIRLRLEHRPKGEPSDLSIRQLLRECKEVILGAVLVKDYYFFMVDGILGPEDSDHERLENEIEEFEQDLQCMLKMYFEYLHNVIHMLQRLPQASKGLKNVLEEEWQFVKHRCQHIREGAAEGGTRFCVMAAGLLESTADFLDSGLDQCCTDLHDNADHKEDPRRKVIETCRSLKLLFNEVRERASKALGFTKKLRIDLENAAKFKIDVGTSELLSMLEKTGHVQVVVRHTTGLLMFVPRHVLEKTSQIIDLLDACCGHKKKKPKPEICKGYLLVMPSSGVEGGAGTPMWGGEKVTIAPTVDTAIGLADIQVDGLILVVGKSYQLDDQRAMCLQALNVVVSVVKERTSSHQAISDSLDELQNAALSLRERIVSAIGRANENLDVCAMFDMEDREIQLVCQNAVETMYTCFNFGFEYQKEIARMVTGTTREVLGRDMLNFAKKWMTFVMEKCEKGRGRRPRWATQGLEFLTVACDPKSLNSLTESEFQELKKQINDCIAHVVGSAEGGPTSSAYRPHSPAIGLAATPTKTAASSALLRPFSFPAGKSPSPKKEEGDANSKLRSLSEPAKSPHFHSIADDARGEGSETEDEDMPDRSPAKRSTSHKDSLDYSNAPKMERVRHALRRLEEHRNMFLMEKGRVGKVSSKSRDITSELANISNRRVPFKWQRGFKIGEGQFGKVYTSVNLDSGDFMAMKQIRFHPNDHSEIKELADEIKNFEGIQHESLVKYYGVELHRDEMFIFMEYCADGTISDVAKLGLPESMIRAYTMQILVAVNVLHERGIIHRDIKGANIFLSENGLLKLGDFGSSIKLKNQSQTMHGEVMNVRGTVAYMAPEVITMDKGAGYGRAADIWSIGCVVVEMAAGKPPWHECDNNWAIMFRVGDGGIPAIPETLSEEGQDFLYGCFLHDPRERPTANDLMDHSFVKVSV